MYKSPVDGRALVEVAQEDGTTKYRDRGTGAMYDEAYVKENCEKFPEPGEDRTEAPTVDSSEEDAKPKKSGRKGRAAKADATKNPPAPKNNGQADDSDES